jgi:hypothetical protein
LERHRRFKGSTVHGSAVGKTKESSGERIKGFGVQETKKKSE